MEVRTSVPHSEFRIPHWGGVVRLDEFRALVARLQSEIPSEFTGGVVAVDVSPKALPHPVHGDEMEEHTSELQSPVHLVCRLLLEKKKKPYVVKVVLSPDATTQTALNYALLPEMRKWTTC